MSEIDRLRTRLKNVPKNVIEYRMTVKEARGLLAEIEEILNKKVEVQVKEIIETHIPKSKILDGGSF